MTVQWPRFALLILVPVAPALQYLVGAAAPWVFLAGAVAIGVLADWISRATEQLAGRVGQAVGGLVNISFGSLAEFILALFVLAGDQPEVVRARRAALRSGAGGFALEHAGPCGHRAAAAGDI